MKLKDIHPKMKKYLTDTLIYVSDGNILNLHPVRLTGLETVKDIEEKDRELFCTVKIESKKCRLNTYLSTTKECIVDMEGVFISSAA